MLSAMFVCLLVGGWAFAGQALYMNSSGTPLVWDASDSDPIIVHPESGACGQFSNVEMLSLLETNLEEWSTVTTVDLAFSVLSGEIDSVDGANYADYLVGVSGLTQAQNEDNVQDGLNPVLFDDDGEIVDQATGENSGRFYILGFASPSGFALNGEGTDYETIVDGQAVFNCYCLEDATGDPAHADCNSILFTTDDLDFTMVHELGHMINLDHTQVNIDLADDDDEANDDHIPTMFPASVNAAVQKTPMQDDVMALSALYPDGNFFTQGNAAVSSYCKVTGALLDRFGEAIRCADVQAITSDEAKNVSFISGSYAVADDTDGDGYTDGADECTSGCGNFTLYLEPATTYALSVASINSGFTGGSSVGPCASAQLTVCTDSIITACTDDVASTTCTACVKEDPLTTNDASADIAAKIQAECTAGAVVSLGDITTRSVSKPSAAESNGDGDSDDDDNTSSSSSGCSLNPDVKKATGAMGFFCLIILGPLLSFLTKRLTIIHNPEPNNG